MRISLIITCHNQAKYLLQLLSILNKYCNNSNRPEIIIIDSSDSPLVGLENYIYERIPNNGPSFARNFGASKATNEWLIFCDADDIVNPFIFSHLPYFVNEEADAFFFDFKKGYENEIIKDAADFYHNAVFSADSNFEDLTDPVVFLRIFFPIHAVLVKKSVFNKVRFKEDQWLIEDVRFYLEMTFDKTLKLKYCNEKYFTSFHRYFTDKESLSTSNTNDFWRGVADNYNYVAGQVGLTVKQRFGLIKIMLLSYHSVNKEQKKILADVCKPVWNYFFGIGKLFKNKIIFKLGMAFNRSFT